MTTLHNHVVITESTYRGGKKIGNSSCPLDSLYLFVPLCTIMQRFWLMAPKLLEIQWTPPWDQALVATITDVSFSYIWQYYCTRVLGLHHGK